MADSEATALANGTTANGSSSRSSTTYHCDTCGTDCTSVRYHSLKVKGFELCPPCYLDGRFPSSMFSGDFVKLSSTANGIAHGTDDDWTDQEVLQLLEAVEMYDDDWSRVEEHVGTRNAQQCIRKFLELPIEDPYLATEGSMGPLRFGRVPFEQADNPVMSVVAFLAGVVGPGVAAEAAKTALHDLTSAEEGEDAKNGQKGDDADVKNDEDRMDEDTAHSNESPAKKSIPHSKVVRAADLALKSSAKAAKALADAEETSIRSTLGSLIKLTLSKLELKMSQFEELEDILEDERKALESSRLALAGERANLQKMLHTVKAELAKHGSDLPPGSFTAGAIAPGASFGFSGQGPYAARSTLR